MDLAAAHDCLDASQRGSREAWGYTRKLPGPQQEGGVSILILAPSHLGNFVIHLFNKYLLSISYVARHSFCHKEDGYGPSLVELYL